MKLNRRMIKEAILEVLKESEFSDRAKLPSGTNWRTARPGATKGVQTHPYWDPDKIEKAGGPHGEYDLETLFDAAYDKADSDPSAAIKIILDILENIR